MYHSVNPDQVDSKDPIEFLDRSVDQWTQASDASAVHEPVDLPARFPDQLDRLFYFFGVGNIENERGGPGQSRKLLGIPLFADTGIDVVTPGRKKFAYGSPQAAARPRDEDGSPRRLRQSRGA